MSGSGRTGWAFWLGTALAIVPFSLTLLLITFWIRGHVGGGEVVSWLGPSGFELSSQNGQLRIWLYRGFPKTTPIRWTDGSASLRYDFDENYRYSGEAARGGDRLFGLIGNYPGHTYYDVLTNPGSPALRVTWRHLVMPFALPVVVLAAFPAWWIALPLRRARRRATRQRRGQCVACGYDLRESPQRCPECGETPDGKAISLVAANG